jgi:hypothetical protein
MDSDVKHLNVIVQDKGKPIEVPSSHKLYLSQTSFACCFHGDTIESYFIDPLQWMMQVHGLIIPNNTSLPELQALVEEAVLGKSMISPAAC